MEMKGGMKTGGEEECCVTDREVEVVVVVVGGCWPGNVANVWFTGLSFRQVWQTAERVSPWPSIDSRSCKHGDAGVVERLTFDPDKYMRGWDELALCVCVYVHQRGRWCRLSVTVLNVSPPFFLYSLFTLRSSLFRPAHLSITYLALMFKAHKKKNPATLCFKSLFTSHKPNTLPLFSFLPLPSMQLPTSPFFQPNYTFTFSGLLCQRVGKRVREHVCNTNSMRHTVQMAVLLSLWLPQLKVSRGRAYAGPSVCETQHRITGTWWE